MLRSARCTLSALAVLATASCAPPAPAGSNDRDILGPGSRFAVTLAWDAPATDAAGNPLADLAGYRVYWVQGTSLDRDGQGVSRVDLGLETTHTVEDLPAGSYVFAVSALDEAGNESDLSAPIQATVGGS